MDWYIGPDGKRHKLPAGMTMGDVIRGAMKTLENTLAKNDPNFKPSPRLKDVKPLPSRVENGKVLVYLKGDPEEPPSDLSKP